MTIKPDKCDDKLFSHEGYEYMYIVEGGIRMKMGNDEFDLVAGDSIAFNSKIPHAAVPLEGQTAIVLSAHLKIEALREFIQNN